MAHVPHVLGTGISSMASRYRPVEGLAVRACFDALGDAGVDATDLDLIVVANALGGSADQEMMRGQSWLRALASGPTPVINVENACAGGVTAMATASATVRADAATVLVVGVDTMSHADRSTVAPALLQGVALEDRAALVEAAGPIAPLVAHNASRARDLLTSGRAEIGHLAAVVAKSRSVAAENPIAQRQRLLTPEDVLAAPTVAAPLTRPMCCAYTDGAAAVVLGPTAAGPALRTVTMVSGDGSGEWFSRFPGLAQAAWTRSGIAPEDLDLIELHDVTAAEEISSAEALGLFGPGEAGPATAAGRTRPGGSGISINTSGGLLSRGHPLAATGMAQVVEVADQLRDRAGGRQVAAARAGATVNMGGIIGGEPALIGITVLTRE